MNPFSPRLLLRTFGAAALTLALTIPAHAQNSTWTWPNYNSATSWSSNASWAGGIPTASNTAIFNNPGDQIITVSTGNVTGGITFSTNGTFTNDYYFNGGSLVLSNGAVVQTDSSYLGIAGFNTAPVLAGNVTFAANGGAGSGIVFANTTNTTASLGAVTLTLEGSNSGYHTFAGNIMGGIISQGTGTTLKLAKNGTGTWVILGGNSFTGGVDLNGGTLVTGSSTAFGPSGAISVLSNSTIRTATALNDPSSRITISDGATLTFDTFNQNTTWAGVLGNSGASNTAGLTKAGLGVLTWRGANATQTYRGATTVNAGQLVIDGLTAGNTTAATMVNPISSDSTLVLGGGILTMRAGTAGTANATATVAGSNVLTLAANNTTALVGSLVTGANVTANTTIVSISGPNITLSNNLTGGASGSYNFGATSLTQTFNGTTLNPGISEFRSTATSGTNIINFGNITRSSGGVLNIVTASGFTFQTSSPNDTAGAIKGVLFNQASDFARVSGGNLTAATYTTQNNASLWNSGATIYTTNGTVTSAVGTGGTTDIGGLKLNFAGVNSFSINGTLRTANGIIFGSSIGNAASEISGGNLTSVSGDLIIANANNQNNYTRNTVSSTIVDNGSATDVVLLGGAGTLYISGNNTYTGNTYVAGGQNGGSGTVLVGGAAGASIGSAGKTVFVNGGTGGASSVLRVGNGDATGDVKGTIDLVNGRLSLNRNDAFTLSASVIGTTGAGSISLDNVGTATLNLGAGNNFFASLGSTANGTLNLAGSGTYTFNSAPSGFAAGSTTNFNSGTYYFGAPGNAANTIGTWVVNGANVTIAGGRYFNNQGGNLTLNSGTFKVNGTAVTGANGGTTSNLTVYNVTGGTFTTAMASNTGVAASLSIGSGNVTSTGANIFNQSGGVVNVSVPNNANTISTLGQGLSIGVGGSTHESSYNLSGGTLRNFGGIYVFAPVAAPGVGGSNNFNWTGGTLTTASYNGSFLLSNSVNNTLVQNGASTVMSPGDFYEGTLYSGRTAISGSYQINSGTVAIGLGGTTAAGSFHETSVNRYDQITVSGATTLGGRLALTLNNGYTPPSDVTTKFDILTGSAAGITGAFTNGMVASGGNVRVVLADGLSSMLVAVNNTGSTATVGGLTSVGSYRVAVGGFQSTNTYNASTGSSWDAASAASWSAFDAGSSTGASGAIAQFADGAGTSAGENVVNLNATRNVRGLDFSSTTSGKNYTISNAGSGAITFDNTANAASATISDTSASGAVNTVAVPLTLTSNLSVSISNAPNRVVLSGIISGTARSLTKTGAGILELQGANSYTGVTTVSAGTLLVNGSTAAGSAVTVASGATLGGNGSVGGAVTLNGVLAPGNSIGTLSLGSDLTWNSSGTLLMELGTAGVSLVSFGTSDQVAITGNFNKGSGTTFAFDFGGTGDLGWYRLANWGGTTNFTSTDFTATNLAGGYAGNFEINSGALYLNVIPEPSTYALVALGLAGLVALRRRPRKA